MNGDLELQRLCNLILEKDGKTYSALSTAEWEALTCTAQAAGVAPFIYWALSRSGQFSALPPTAQRSLRAAYSQTWKQNQDILAELETLAEEFARARIPLVVLKGACYALTIYPDLGTRPMADLDLLVPAAQLSAAVDLAQALGYVDAKPEAAPGLRALLNHEVCLQKRGARSVTLELHRSLVADKTYKYAVPVDWFWTQTEELHHPRFPHLLRLTPAAQVLYASAHAMLQHGGGLAPLRWFVDLDRLIRVDAERLDWAVLLAQAKTFGWSSAVAAALARTQEYFATPIPASVSSELSSATDAYGDLVRLLAEKPATRIEEERRNLASMDLRGRLRLLLALIFPSPAYLRWRYGVKSPWLLPFYYPFRWWGIAKDGWRTLALLLAKKFHTLHFY